MRYKIEFDSYEITKCIDCPFHVSITRNVENIKTDFRHYCRASGDVLHRQLQIDVSIYYSKPKWCPLQIVKHKKCGEDICLKEDGKCSSCELYKSKNI